MGGVASYPPTHAHIRRLTRTDCSYEIQAPIVPTTSMQRQLSDWAIELLVSGLGDISLGRDDALDDLGAAEPDPDAQGDVNLKPDEFVTMFQSKLYAWYDEKTTDEKRWLDTSRHAEAMIDLALSEFDDMLR